MQGRIVVAASVLLVGCQGEKRVVSTVVLPEGLPTYKGESGLRREPTPESIKLLPPAPRIDGPPVVSKGERTSTVLSPASSNGPQVEGVCRYGEAEASCWDTQGALAPKLSAAVKSLLKSNSVAAVNVGIGNKNRIVLIRSARQGQGEASTDVELVSEGPGATSSLINPSQIDPRQFLFVSLPAATTTCSVRFVERSRLTEQSPILLTVGKEAKLAGCRLRVSEVAKLSDEDMDRFFVRGRPAWRVVIKPVGPGKPDVAFFPVDPFPIYLPDGRRAVLSSDKKGLVYAPQTAPKVQSVFYTGLADGAVAVLIDRDPKMVKSLKLGANREVRTVMTDIPLDPR